MHCICWFCIIWNQAYSIDHGTRLFADRISRRNRFEWKCQRKDHYNINVFRIWLHPVRSWFLEHRSGAGHFSWHRHPDFSRAIVCRRTIYPNNFGLPLFRPKDPVSCPNHCSLSPLCRRFARPRLLGSCGSQAARCLFCLFCGRCRWDVKHSNDIMIVLPSSGGWSLLSRYWSRIHCGTTQVSLLLNKNSLSLPFWVKSRRKVHNQTSWQFNNVKKQQQQQ